MKNIDILQQLLDGNHLNESELLKAEKVIKLLQAEIRTRRPERRKLAESTNKELTKARFLAKIAKIKDRIVKDLNDRAVKKAEHIFDSGGLEPAEWQDNFELPMAVMKLILEEQARGYTIVTHRAKKTYNNLKLF